MKNLNEVFCHQHAHSQPREPDFKLCPECHQDAPHEAKVVENVINYFSPILRNFFIETEYEIQMGSDKRRSDIVLGVDSLDFIVECKREGLEYVEDGINQLKSYLCATDTPLGIYADSTNVDNWAFYENLGKNKFNKITWDQFWNCLQNISGENIAEALFEAGQNHSRKSQYEDAITHYTYAISINVEYTSAYISRADAKRGLSQYEAAVADYDKAIEFSPSADLYDDRGFAKYSLGQYEAAIADYDKAIEFNPSANLYNNRGFAKYSLGQYEAAVADYDKAIEFSPSARLYRSRGAIKYSLGQYEAAVADFDKAIEISLDALTYYYRGKTKVEWGKYGDAVTDFDKAIELEINSYLPDTYYYRGRAKIRCREIYDFHDGIADFDKAIELNPDHTFAYIYRGIAQVAIKKYSSATNDFDKAMELEPDNEIAPILRELCSLLLPLLPF